MRNALFVLLAWLCSASAYAHRASDSFVTLRPQGSAASGEWEIALRDLAAAEDIDTNADQQLTWGELRGAMPLLQAHLTQELKLESAGRPCALSIDDLQINDRLDGRYAWLSVSARCPSTIRQLGVSYSFLSSVDPSHRGILVIHSQAGSVQTAVLGPQRSRVIIDLAGSSHYQQFQDYLREGVHHIWIGADHILFLLSLLLPAVLVRHQDRWSPASRLRDAGIEVLGVVTAFTVAHSITLSLATLDVVRLPSRLTESAIAASVILAALNNLWPVVTRKRWCAGFAFGLVHGFGFASVLGEMGLPADARLLSLFSFNLGVEIGQLTIVLTFVPLAFLLRRSPRYEPLALRSGSAVVAAIASWWLVSRAAGM